MISNATPDLSVFDATIISNQQYRCILFLCLEAAIHIMPYECRVIVSNPIVDGALYRVARRYCLMLRTLVVFSFRQSSTYWICEPSNFNNWSFTTSIGYSLPEILTVDLVEHKTSTMMLTISSIHSRSRWGSWIKHSYSMLFRSIDEWLLTPWFADRKF